MSAENYRAQWKMLPPQEAVGAQQREQRWGTTEEQVFQAGQAAGGGGGSSRRDAQEVPRERSGRDFAGKGGWTGRSREESGRSWKMKKSDVAVGRGAGCWLKTTWPVFPGRTLKGGWAGWLAVWGWGWMGSTSAGREGWGLWEASREPRGASVRRKELDTIALLTQRCSEEREEKERVCSLRLWEQQQ